MHTTVWDGITWMVAEYRHLHILSPFVCKDNEMDTPPHRHMGRLPSKSCVNAVRFEEQNGPEDKMPPTDLGCITHQQAQGGCEGITCVHICHITGLAGARACLTRPWL